MQVFRQISQLIFLAIFITLMVLGKAQFWMAFIFGSILLAIFFGRYYCGWACPINTLIGPINSLAKKAGTQRSTPSFLKTEVPRLIVFLIFLAGLGYTVYTISQGRKFPLPLIVIPFGLLVTFFINPVAWHRYLCPWGMFFSLTARLSRHGIRTGNSCTGCQSCGRTCPTHSLSYPEGEAKVDPTNCLLCLRCISNCQQSALRYSYIRTKQNDTACPT